MREDENKSASKELACLLKIENILNKSEAALEETLAAVLKELPSAFNYSDQVESKIIYKEQTFRLHPFPETPWFISAKIQTLREVIGEIIVYYEQEFPFEFQGAFTESEVNFLVSLANRLGVYFNLRELIKTYPESNIFAGGEVHAKESWRVILDLLRKTEPHLFHRILRKLLHQLVWDNAKGAQKLLELSSGQQQLLANQKVGDENKPLRKKIISDYDEYIEAILGIASETYNNEEILAKIQKWVKEDRSSGLIKALENQESSLTEISDAIRKYYHIAPEKFELSPSVVKGLRVSLLRRFFTDQMEYINIAKEYVKITDFYKLIDNMIFSHSSHGKLGGKSAGLFLAKNILERSRETAGITFNIKSPKTWYIASDGVLNFMHFNDLEDVLEQKYKSLEEVRLEYPQIIQVFKNSDFPPEMIKGLSMALDDLGDKPLIVRSSSLMEDQIGAAFSGKYKSLFLANRGTKRERLSALLDAVAEVYASTFGPDPIEYRSEKGLLDFHEEMGIMIQEVVGTQVGKYYLPAFAGVAFSNNEFRWSPRIKREDGLVRIVPGLGTRAVDRLGDDYPILAAPAQPKLRVNITPEGIIRYSPRYVDVINLETNQFETIEIEKLLKETGGRFPQLKNVFSEISGTMIRPIMNISFNIEPKNLVANFETLFTQTDFLENVDLILKTLEEKLSTPVDIEFACDEKDFYILQCRPQYRQGESGPDSIPENYPEDKILFTANKYVSNGRVSDISFVVYVDPVEYSQIASFENLKRIGRAVSLLNKKLPRRKFILMGPGRWGSRGDIKLGVSVTYSDINNTAMLIEIARKKGNYTPDLSFGTHFFQDLAEASIRYLPLYPDDPGIIFNYDFFFKNKNSLELFAPEFADLQNVIKVIDVPGAFEGNILKVLMNAELDKAMGIITSAREDFNIEFSVQNYMQNFDSDLFVQQLFKNIKEEIERHNFGVVKILLLKRTHKKEKKQKKYRILFLFNNFEKLKKLQSFVKGFIKGINFLSENAARVKIARGLDFDYMLASDFIMKKEDIQLDYYFLNDQ